MKTLIIRSTEISPQITFNPEKLKFEISGESRPEDAGKLYGLVLSWLEEYLLKRKKNGSNQNPLPIKFEFNLIYFNTVSAKYVLEILRLLHLHYSKGFDIRVLWHYKTKDEDMKESGEEFARLVNIPFEFIQIN
jgi:hypothetical protein